MVRLDRKNKRPGIQNGGHDARPSAPSRSTAAASTTSRTAGLTTPRNSGSPPRDSGLCASLYAASEVKAKVGDGTTVNVAEDTDYPFSDTIRLRLSLPYAVRFPLYLRVPGWCRGASVTVNGTRVRPGANRAHSWRSCAPGSTVILFPCICRCACRCAPGQRRQRGLRLLRPADIFAEDRREVRRATAATATGWSKRCTRPLPGTTGSCSTRAISLARSSDPSLGYAVGPPFTPDSAPILLHAKARRIPAWTLDRNGLVGKLQPSPVRSDEPVEAITLIPMGAARLRITVFPVIGNGPAGHQWKHSAAVKRSDAR